MSRLPYADKAWFKHPGAEKRTSPTEQQAEFIEWLVDPNRVGSQAEYARTHDVSSHTLTQWKKETYFREAWDARLKELNISPDRIQKVVNAIFDKAVGGDTKAASLYLQYIDRFTPKSVQTIEDRSVRDLSDEELAESLRDAADDLSEAS